ncbi:MAG: RNA methyltransferase substrate-binding domain-containing protein, partial [Anaerovoracaceae bacterium]
MAKVKNKRANHDTKRGRYYAERGREMPGRENQTRNGGSGKPERSGAAGRTDRSASTGRPIRTAKPKRAERADFAGGWEKAERNDQPDTNLIIGRNPVTEALKSGREVDKLMVSSREGSMIKILALAKEQSVPVIMVEKAALDRIAAGRPHQGVV